MLRLLFTTLIAATLVASGVAAEPPSKHPEPAPAPPSPSTLDDCASITFVKSKADELAIDLYITKLAWPTAPPTHPGELVVFIEQVKKDVLRSIDELMEERSFDSGIIQVEAILPEDEDTGTPGYRFTLLVKTSACGG